MSMAEDQFRPSSAQVGDEPTDRRLVHSQRVEVDRSLVTARLRSGTFQTVLLVVRVAPHLGDALATPPTAPFVGPQRARPLPRQAAGIEPHFQRHAGRAGGLLA